MNFVQPMISGAAMDLGLRANLSDKETEEERKKKQQAQQQRQNSLMPTPYSGAFMSLTGNQF